MKRNQLIDPNPDDLKGIIAGHVDIFFEKSGKKLEFVNVSPKQWQLLPDSENTLCKTEDASVRINILPKYKPGETYQLTEKVWIDIIEARLIRLEDVTEEDAIQAGVIKTEKGYKHYCPEKLFPKKVLNLQEPGFPYMENARSSYFTKWIKKYGVLDVSFNPWIWRYKFKVNITITFPN